MLDIQQIKDLRHELFDHAEISSKEVQTKKILMDFLKQHTSLEVVDCGDFFYAKHIEEHPNKPSIALRADYDALLTPSGKAKHLCGHDGHSATLCGLACLMEGNTYDRNIFLLFQPEEETGYGAKKCLKLFELEDVDEIYGLHNLPGKEFGHIYTRYNTFACASEGVILKFQGLPTHAAYPELGINPSHAVASLLLEIEDYVKKDFFDGMVLSTVIGVDLGEKAFGASAEKAEVYLTLRAERSIDLKKLEKHVLEISKSLSTKEKLEFSYELIDVFPSVENHQECVDDLVRLLHAELLDVPMRWSEDFGHYLNHCKGAFFGIGAGVDYPGLHTLHYEYNDELLKPSIEAFHTILKK